MIDIQYLAHIQITFIMYLDEKYIDIYFENLKKL